MGTREMDVPEDDKSKMSLQQKMALFKKLEDEKKAAAQCVAASHVQKQQSRRYADRKKRELRPKTQPVTVEELTKASDLAKSEGQSGETGGGSQEDSPTKSKGDEQDNDQASED